MGRREDRAAQERVGYAVMWMFLVGIFGVVFPPLWLLFPIPLLLWWAGRQGGGSRFSREAREADSWSEMFERPAGWYRHPLEKRHVSRWWDGRRWTLHRFDRRAMVYLPPAQPTGAAAERAQSRDAEEVERERMRGAVAGWYPHPREKRHVLRWWDGRQWTLHRFDGRAQEYLSPATW